MLRAPLYACLGLGLLSFLVVPARATTSCLKSDNCWTSSTTLIPWTQDPTVFCIPDHPIIKIESFSACNSNKTAGPSVTLVCGAASFSISYSGDNNTTHTLGTTSNWTDVLWGAGCSSLTYEVH